MRRSILQLWCRSSLLGSVLGLALTLLFPRAISCDQAVSAGRYNGWMVSGFHLIGLERVQTSALMDGLALAGQRGFFGTTRPPFSAELLEMDLARVRLFLSRDGYPEARIDVELQPEVSRSRVSVVLKVELGQRVRLGDVDVRGMPRTLASTALEDLRIRSGMPFSEDKLHGAKRALIHQLGHAGYARAEVDLQVERTDDTLADVVFLVRPGPIFHFGKVRVQGVTDDLRPVVRRTVAIKHGQRFNPDVLERAQESLRLLVLFREIRIETQEAAPGTLDVSCQLSERLHRNVQTGIGFWTEDLLRVRAGWESRNRFGEARGMAVGTTFSRFEQTANVSFWKPTLWASRTRGTLNVNLKREGEETYTALGTEIEAALTYTWSFQTILRFGVATSWTDYKLRSEFVEAFQEQGNRLTNLTFTWTHDTSDNRVWPTSGRFKRASLEWGPPGFISKSHYVLGESEIALYTGLGRGSVLASRLLYGLGFPTGDSEDLLPNKRFYSGGASSMRGFGRRKLGPLDAEGHPLGGESKLETTIELRYPLYKRLHAALFVDSGQTWSRYDQPRLLDLEVAAGGGLMLLTPVGPIRFDAGHRLTTHDTTQPATVYHLSIGNPF